MLRMILTDFDGTLFSGQEDKLSDSFVTKIRRLTDCGMIFAVNSGRPYHSLRKELKALESRTIFICNDGAQIMYKNCLLKKTIVDKKQAQPVIDLALKEGLTPFAALRERTLPITGAVPESKGFLGEDIYKLVFVKNKASADGIQKIKELAEAVGLRACYEDAQYIELCHSEANKGSAAAYLKERFRIKDGVAAFGDGENDISMFRQADHVYLIKSSRGICYPGARVIENMQSFVVDEL